MNRIRCLLTAAAWMLACLPMGASAQPAPTRPVDECYTCHRDIETPQAMAFQKDIHFEKGVGCADCHGGNPASKDQEAGMSRASGYRGKIAAGDIPGICGRCHGKGNDPFKNRFKLTNVADSLAAGVHGEALRENPKGPQCVSCHGVHDITRVTDPRSPVHPTKVVATCARCHSDARYMREFDPRLPIDQHAKYITSVHGRLNAKGDPKPATCVSCHSNHMVLKVKDPRSPTFATRIPQTCAKCHSNAKYMAEYKLPTDQYDNYKKSVHGIALLQKSDLNAPACNSCHGNHGAVPPGAASVVAVCGNCHQTNRDLYEKSAHKGVFEQKKLAGCVVCHSNHLIRSPGEALLSFEDPSPCAKCHHREASADKSAPAFIHLRALLDSLRLGNEDAKQVLEKAEQLGMDVSDARFDLKTAHQALVQSRVAIHSFKVADLAEVARPGLAVIATTHKAGEAAIREYHFRRKGLVVSTLIVTVFAILLYLKIRQIENKED